MTTLGDMLAMCASKVLTTKTLASFPVHESKNWYLSDIMEPAFQHHVPLMGTGASRHLPQWQCRKATHRREKLMASKNLIVDDESSDDIAPETLHATVFSRDHLPRFSSKRTSSNLSIGDGDVRVSRYMHGAPKLTQQDLSSADALMAKGVHAMNETLAAVVQEALGAPIPSIEVRFRDLRIAAKVPQITSTSTTKGKPEVPTLWTHVKRGLSKCMCCCSTGPSFADKVILRGISGVFKPGRLTLVLGQPGSGKSSLMKILSGRFPLDKSITFEGDITYNEMDRASVLARLPRFVGYVDQKDDHYPRLSVLETFAFAHRCCAGTQLEPWVIEAISNCTVEQHDHALKVMTAHHKHSPDLMVKKLGLERCKNTIVGDAMLRGVSGGERKRVTTGEMAFGLKKVHLMDEISTGLDAAATFDIVHSLQSVATNFHTTVVISLLQPPPEVFALFDDVLLLNDGHIMYHGPREQVLPFFEDMGFACPPRRDVADFLLDLGTDKQHAYIATEHLHHAKSMPFLAADFAERFRRSDVYQATLETLATPCVSSCELTVLEKRGVFRQTFYQDLATLLERQMLLTLRNTAFLAGRAVMVIVMGVLYGSTFWQLDATNAQLVLGLLFSCAMFLSMGQASQVPTFMDARSVFYKQRGSNFFRSSAYVLASSMTTIPFGIMETVLFGAVVYWMGGYVALVDRFIVFLLTLFLCQMWFTSFFFCLSSLAPNLTIAQPTMMVSILFFMLFSGFLLTKSAIPEYFLWIYWINPLAWCIRGLSINQYTAPPFNVCVYGGVDYCARFKGQTMGEYSLALFGLPSDRQWIYWSWCYFAIGYVVLVGVAYLALEYQRYESPETTSVVKTDLVQDQDGYIEAPETPRMGTSDTSPGIDAGLSALSSSSVSGVSTITLAVDGDDNAAAGRRGIVPVALAFQDLYYSVPLPGGKSKDEEIDLLQGVSGFALPGTMTALMGSSGAGKTTLMDVIAGRKTGGRIRGKILLNGFPATDLAIRRCTGYCEQMDIHSDSATVYEALMFSAMLRQDARVSTADKLASVHECIELLELEPIAHTLIRTASTEQMKRVTIGVELAAHPSILFMDEPTSGLDARAAKLIMRGVRKIADTGRTVVCTIHQPSTDVFHLFDALLLLQRGGRTVFFGELGNESAKLIAYFNGVPGVTSIEPSQNPATWMLECIGAGVPTGSSSGDGGKTLDAPPAPQDFAEYFITSDQKKLLDEDLDQDGVTRPSEYLPELKFGTKRAALGRTQFTMLCMRFFRMYWRTPTYNLTRLIISVALGAIYGVVYQGTDYGTFNGANAGVGLVFVSTIFLGLIGFNSVMPIAAAERTAFYRERASQTYNALWYFVAGTLAEIPYVALSSLLFTSILFPSVGFLTDSGDSAVWMRFALYWFIVALHVLLQVYMGQLLVYVLPSVEVASILGALLSSMYMLFAGFNPPAGNIPSAYKWIHYIAPPTYSIAALAALVFADCPSDEDDTGEYLGCNVLADAPPQYGSDLTLKSYIEGTFDMKHAHIATDLLLLVALIVVFRVLALLGLRYVNHMKR
ncbi:Abc transporter g family member 31, partial [Globisporangium splendens]